MSSSNILLAYGNKAPGATLAGGSWDSTLTLNNIKTRKLAQVARSTNTSIYNTQFRFDLAANYTLRALALVNHNLTTGARWRARTTAATMDMDFVGPTSMKPVTLTTSGGANGTRVNVYGQIEAATCPRYDFSPVNLASGTATQTISNVPAGTYVLVTTGSNAAVMATGSTVSNTGTIGTTTYPAFVVVNATGNVTLTVLSAATAIHFRESLGLLVEEARTNLLLRSSALLTSPWSPGNLSYSGATIAAPDGSSVQPITTTGGGSTINFQQMTAPAVPFTISVYVRDLNAGSNSMVNKYGVYNGSTSSDVAYLAVDYATGAVAASGPYAGSSVVRSTPCHNGWHRVSITISAGVTPGDIINIYAGALGDIPSAGVSWYAWGLQMEAGAFPTSYIPTTSAAVTRTADSSTITGSDFSAVHSATAGTLFAEFSVMTTSAGTRPILSLDDNTANERIELYTSGADIKFKVVDGGSTVVDLSVGTVAADTVYKIAAAWSANDFAASLSGAAVVTDTSGTLPTVDRMRIGSNQASDFLCGHVRRFARYSDRLTNAELQAVTTTGPDALGIDTGWQNALQLTFHGDTPANWGEQYPLIAAFDAAAVRYGTIEIDDTTNPDAYVELGQFFAAGGFQPGGERNAEYQGFGDGRTDLSSSVKSVGGQKYSTARRRPRTVDFNFPVLEQDEGDHLDEMMAEVGTTEDVLYVPDPSDPAKTQRYGFLGTLRELTPLEYPFFDHRAMPLRLEQKL